MGEIFKAQDTRLNRFVAIKVLSTSNSGDPERRRRFVQEAQAASALNHPNIEARMGQGRVFLLGPEMTHRAQPHGTFKFVFNAIYSGSL